MTRPIGKIYTLAERRQIALHVKSVCEDNGLKARYVRANSPPDSPTWCGTIVGTRRLNSEFKIDYTLVFFFDTRANRIASIELKLHPSLGYLPDLTTSMFDPYKNVYQLTLPNFGSAMAKNISKTREVMEKTRAAVGFVTNLNATIQSVLSQLKSEATHYARTR